jgi:phosphotransferase system  glucose/maltose/N-acetylglucosamine-specific IIC component
MLCKNETGARKRYQRDVVRFMAAYIVVLLGSSWFVKHDGVEHFYLYFWSLIPALPIIAMILRMGRYLREETDEYQKLMRMRAILAGTAALLGALVVDDFLRAFAHAGGFPPFVLFIIFAIAMGTTESVQSLVNRARNDE